MTAPFPLLTTSGNTAGPSTASATKTLSMAHSSEAFSAFTNGTFPDANYEIPIGVAGVFSNYGTLVTVNPRTSTTTFNPVFNGTQSAANTLYTSTQAGFFQDTTHTDSVSVGTTVMASETNGAGSGSIQGGQTTIFTPNSGCSAMLIGSAGTSTALSATEYMQVVGACNGSGSTAAQCQFLSPNAGTASYFYGCLFSNSHTAQIDEWLTVNGTDVNGHNLWAANTPGLVNDTTHSDHYNTGDEICSHWILTAGSGSATILCAGYTFVSDADGTMPLSSVHGTTGSASSVNGFFTPTGNFVDNATESPNNQIEPAVSNLTFSGFTMRLSSSASAAGAVYFFRKNAANGNQNVSFGSNQSGTHTDTTNIDVLNSTDKAAIGVTTLNGSVSMNEVTFLMTLPMPWNFRAINITQAVNRAGTY